MTNTEWLLLQFIGDAIVLWICLVVYRYIRSQDTVDDVHDEHEDVDQVRG